MDINEKIKCPVPASGRECGREEILSSVHPEMVHLARVQGGQQIQTGDIWLIFRGFEFTAQRRNRVRGAVSGWALSKKRAIPKKSTGGRTVVHHECEMHKFHIVFPGGNCEPYDCPD